MQNEKDKHQEEIISIQNNYNEKLRTQMIELESLKINLEEKQSALDDTIQKLNLSKNMLTASSNKSEDGWYINGER
jgi:hypothetical protein